MENFRCKRCGYQGKQLSDIKKHYNKKHVCSPIYCDLSYEDLLNKIARGEHCNPVFREPLFDEFKIRTPRNSYTVGENYKDEDGKEYRILDLYLMPNAYSQQEFFDEISKGLKVLRVKEDFVEKNIDVDIIITTENSLLLLDPVAVTM